MSFYRLDPRDVVVSTDSVSSTVWSGNTPILSSFALSTAQQSLGTSDFYGEVRTSDDDTLPVEFSLSYANSTGAGATPFNASVAGNTPTSTIYRQMQNLILGGDEDFVFGGTTSTDFYVITIDRARYKEKLLPGSFNLRLTEGSNTIDLTDNSLDVSVETFTEAGRVYDIVSGSNGTQEDTAVTSFGWVLPDVGLALLDAAKIDTAIGTDRTAISSKRYTELFGAIDAGNSFRVNSEETLSSNYIFARVRSDEANYSSNPSIVSGSSGDLLHDELIYSPTTYITSVGIYNDANELLAVAKLSKPLKKDFTKEALIRIKLDY